MQFVEDSRAAVEDISARAANNLLYLQNLSTCRANVGMPDEPARALGSEAQLLRQVRYESGALGIYLFRCI